MWYQCLHLMVCYTARIKAAIPVSLQLNLVAAMASMKAVVPVINVVSHGFSRTKAVLPVVPMVASRGYYS
jgi:hypothetical protein